MLADLEEQVGDEEHVAKLRYEAHLTLEDIIEDIIKDIIEHIPEGELRALFVGLSAVRALLTGLGQA